MESAIRSLLGDGQYAFMQKINNPSTELAGSWLKKQQMRFIMDLFVELSNNLQPIRPIEALP